VATTQHCPHCGAKIYRFDRDCPACHEPTGQRLPFYIYLIGAGLVFLLFLAFADFPALFQFFVILSELFRH